MNLDRTETIMQLGGTGFSGAFAYTGTSKFSCHGDTAIMQVNGKPGYKSFVTVTLEPADYYTVRYVTVRGINRVEVAKETEVYREELQRVVETMYDHVMNTTNRGFIPLGAT